MKPEELKFAATHEWVHVAEEAGDKIATVGISAVAVEALTDLVYMDLPTVGTKVTAGSPFGEVESVKATSDLYSPIDGEIVAVNSDLPDNLDTLGNDPYGAGWIIKVKLASEEAVGKLMDFEAYQKQNG
jgi:glycine cleavage system H protein